MTAPVWLTSRPIAHRGLHGPGGPPENTIAAAEAAIAGGYGIECDVQLSADGEAMVFHDDLLDRLTTEAGEVRGRNAAELTRLTIAGSAETIPILADFLDRIGDRAPVVIEIKSQFDGNERLTRRVVETAHARGARLALKSFDPAVVSLLRRIAPTIPRGIVAQECYAAFGWYGLDPERLKAMSNLSHWPETEPDFVSYRHLDLPGQTTLMPHILDGVPVLTWTVRSQAEADRASAFADQIVFEGFVPA